jgi:acetate kinase
MSHAHPVVLTINSGSSSIKFALFSLDDAPRRWLAGSIDGVGSAAATLRARDRDGTPIAPLSVDAPDPAHAAEQLAAWLAPRLTGLELAAVAHRIVHGGPTYDRAQVITPDLIEGLRRFVPFAPNHLPGALALVDAFTRATPGVTQVACFDTAFHRDLPDVARTLPIPRAYAEAGVRRYGFHGLSYAFLVRRLDEIAGRPAATGRLILAHLGNGASLAAVSGGRCIDTSMGFTPTGGLVMSTRSGDLDPGLVAYLARTSQLTPEALDDLLSRESGLLGLSGRSADMRELLAHEGEDASSRLAVAIFCYQVKKWIGAFAAALGGLDTLVFTGGIGEHAPIVRARVCEGLAFLGVHLDATANQSGAPVISSGDSLVTVRVIPTDEEIMMARETSAILRDAQPVTPTS